MLRLSQQLTANAMDVKGLHSSNSLSDQSDHRSLINSTGLSFLGTWLLQGRGGGGGRPIPATDVVQRRVMNFFIVRVTEHGNRLPREAVESLSLETFKTCLDMFLCGLS
uniref:Uncharacterized protein n=1 Tax=Hypotaenidia okinawae TaxID=2861861 RepID=A0A6G1S1C4_9GRUI